MERKNIWTSYSQQELEKLEAINADYRNCLDRGKTERECVRLTVERIEAQGYRNLDDLKKSPQTLKPGDKIGRAHV